MTKVEDGVFQASRGPLHLGKVLRLFRPGRRFCGPPAQLSFTSGPT
ncbi:hypothetical protein [Streptomyces sp. NPDC001978]